MSKKIIVLHQEVPAGAREDERDTVLQAAFVSETLKDLGYEPKVMTVGLDLGRARRRLASRKPRLVFNLVESLDGRGEFIHFAAGLLESLGLPYTGSSARALFLTSHKLLAKEIMRRAGIPTPDWFAPGSRAGNGRSEVFPCLRKSVWEHASLGMDDSALIESATDWERFPPAAGGCVFYERYVEGREFNLSLVEKNGAPRVLAPAEIRFIDFPPGKPKIVGYRAKWESDSFEYRNTRHSFSFPETDRPLLGELKAIARRCWDEFGLAGYARVDFRVDDRGRPWVLEINANPCLAPDAGFYATALSSGFTRESLFDTILKSARVGT